MRSAPPVTAIITAALLVLTGCSGTPETDADAQPTQQTTTNTAQSTEPAPLVAEPLAGDPTDVGYLAEVRLRIEWNVAYTGISNATDEQLISAGHEACEMMAAGTKFDDLRMVEDERINADGQHGDSAAIANAAILNYCPEMNVPETFE